MCNIGGVKGVRGVTARVARLGVIAAIGLLDDSSTRANKRSNVMSSGTAGATITTSSEAAITSNGAKAE